MAENIKKALKPPAIALGWEKVGNVIWMACPDCAGWFHISQRLASADEALVCPFCQSSFRFEQGTAILPW